MIASIGELVLDITIVPEGPLRAGDDRAARISIGGGGQAANFCAWVAVLGQRARLITRLGDDANGRGLVAEMQAYGVDVCAVWGAEPTGAIAVLVGPDGERTMATMRGASVGLRAQDLRDAWFHDVRLIHVPAYSLFAVPLASAARAAVEKVRGRGGKISIDLSSAAGLKEYGPDRMAAELARLKPDLLFATKAEAETLGVPLEDLSAVPVIKLGAEGCCVSGRHIPAPTVKEIDPTGAGDALAASFCASYIEGTGPIEAAKRAVVVAADAVTRAGARPR
jgi:ribokinase